MPPSRVELVRGTTSRQKTFFIESIDCAVVSSTLSGDFASIGVRSSETES
ncbi:MAG: DUF167 domain-containing protein [Proteobacteria bacterium]|nr:DUF167 domain-containing protein [Pseudomonadota bacterium]